MSSLSIRSKYTLCAALSAIVLWSCKDKPHDTPTQEPPVRVSILAVNPTANSASTTYSGTVNAETTTSLSFSVPGTISELRVQEGAKVKKGELLGRVKAGDYENAKNIADAQLAEAMDGYERLKKLHDANALPEVKWVEMQQKLKQAQNAAEMAKRSLEDASLYSPVSGTVSRKLADVGQTVMAIEPVYEIISTDALTVDVPVAENAVSTFTNGQKAKVSFMNSQLEPVEGKVTQKAVVADPLTRSYTVKVSIPSENGKILPGMIANVEFENIASNDSVPQQIILPSQAVLLNEDNRMFVWVIKNNTAQRKFVEVDELVSGGVRVKSGLVAGDSVIVKGIRKVGTGTRVEVVNP